MRALQKLKILPQNLETREKLDNVHLFHWQIFFTYFKVNCLVLSEKSLPMKQVKII